MNKERRLGRGLEALLGRPLAAAVDDEPHGGRRTPASPREGLVQIHVYEIENNPFQPRRDFDEAAIAELCESLKEHGMIQPLVVRRARRALSAHRRRAPPAGRDQGRLAAGAGAGPRGRRPADVPKWRSSRTCSARTSTRWKRPLSFQQYLERYGCTQEELAGRLKIDRSTIANLIRLLELPEAIQQAIRSGALDARARPGPVAAGRRARATGVLPADSGRGAERAGHRGAGAADDPPAPTASRWPWWRPSAPRPKRGRRAAASSSAALEQELRTALGTKVDLKQRAAGRGQIVIHFTSPEEFERLRHLCEHARGEGG